MTVRLVCGPPGAGKSTLVREKRRDGDLVIDLDDIRASVGSEATARKLRSVMEDGARAHEDGDVWIVRTLGDPAARAEFAARVGVDEITVLDVDADTAKARVSARDGSDEKHPAIDRWWAQHTPEGVNEEEPAMGNQQIPTPADVAAQTNPPAPPAAPAAPANPPADPAPAQTGQPSTGGDHDGELRAELRASGVPGDVPVAEMSLEHQAAYWKARARDNERRATRAEREAAREEPAGNTPPAEEPAPDGLTPAQLEVFEARVEAALAARPDYRGVDLAKYLNPSLFVDGDGRVDREAVDTFISSLPEGKATPQTPPTPPGLGSEAPYTGAAGVDAGRAMFDPARHKL